MSGGGGSDVGGGSLRSEREVVRSAGRSAIGSFLDSHNCFSVLRASGKVVVFDCRIPVQLAFYALVEHDMQAAPLWDPATCQFVGLLTVTDFIDVLRYYRRTGGDVSALATRTIADVLSDPDIIGTVLVRHLPVGVRAKSRRAAEKARAATAGGDGDILGDLPDLNLSSDLAAAMGGGIGLGPDVASAVASMGGGEYSFPPPANHHRTFVAASADASLKHACRLLHRHSLDFLPVLLPDDMRVLAVITYTTVLEHLVTHFREQRRLFDDTAFDLGIGTYGDDVVTVSASQSLAEVLNTLKASGLSAVPVVDPENRRVIGSYSRSDITFLAAATDAEDAVANLDASLESLMAQRRTDVTTPDALHTCTVRHTLQSIFEYFAQWKFNRLVVVDDDERVVGVVSARDLVAYFLEEDR